MDDASSVASGSTSKPAPDVKGNKSSSAVDELDMQHNSIHGITANFLSGFDDEPLPCEDAYGLTGKRDAPEEIDGETYDDDFLGYERIKRRRF